jgi:hypothetical protein
MFGRAWTQRVPFEGVSRTKGCEDPYGNASRRGRLQGQKRVMCPVGLSLHIKPGGVKQRQGALGWDGAVPYIKDGVG